VSTVYLRDVPALYSGLHLLAFVWNMVLIVRQEDMSLKIPLAVNYVTRYDTRGYLLIGNPSLLPNFVHMRGDSPTIDQSLK
jgi:hypothetical protein